MSEASKSHMTCRVCNNDINTIRLLWTDYYPEGHRYYDDHVCLECGAYASQPGSSLCEESLVEYRKKYMKIIKGNKCQN
jgi:hypothetical protein